MMGRAELGTKCTCTGCHERFYDLNRSPVICPKCGLQQPLEKLRSLRSSRSTFGARLRQPPTAAAIDDDGEPASTSEVETEVDVLDADDESDEDVEIDPDLATPAD
jgi:uncharacterized protein (TIGR02300 family)